MHKKVYRTQGRFLSTISPMALSLALVAISCFALFCLGARSDTPLAHASAAVSRSPSVNSSPSSGPVGTTVTVNGSGLPVPDGTPVSLGYGSVGNCATVSTVQNGTNGGSFSGSFNWPSAASSGTFLVCVAVENHTLIAGTFTVLSPTPQVSIEPNSLQENEQATITATNYLPAGTTINFLWTTTSGSLIQTLGSAMSNGVGTALFTFTVPVSSLASGTYLIDADGGGGQSSADSSSVSFTYTAPSIQPSPTPEPSPTPKPSPTPTSPPTPTPIPTEPALPGVTPTIGTTPTVLATSTAGVTAIGTATPASGNGATPTAVASSTGTSTTFPSSTSGNGGDTSGGKLNDTAVMLGIVGGTLALAAVVSLAMLFRRWKLNEEEKSQSALLYSPFDDGQFALDATMGIPGWDADPFMAPGAPGSSTTMPYTPVGGQPGLYAPDSFQQTLPFAPAPSMIPVGAGANYAPPLLNDEPANGTANGTAGGAPVQAPPAYRALLNPVSPPPAAHDGIWPVPADPALEAMRRQVQTGLWVEPTPRDGSV